MDLPRYAFTFSALCLTGLIVWSWKLRAALRHTTLRTTWVWAIISEVACWLACVASIFQLPPACADQLWYFTAILILCPFISVLGARSPTNHVWNWFILLPLIAVLGWPALALLFELPQLPRLLIQTPVFVGFFLVLTMGTGNYVGTRYSSVVFLIMAAVSFILIPFSTLASMSLERADHLRGLGSLCFVVAIFHAIRQGHHPTVEEDPFDRLWFDFRDTFGIVWSIRIQERINQTAESEKWLARLGPEGFHWQNLPEADASDITTRREETRQKMEHTLRWLLRRFVGPEWIDQRLGGVESPQSKSESSLR